MIKEYGNYEKYTKNSVETIHDQGKDASTQDKFFENFMNVVKRLPTKEADNYQEKKKRDITQILTDENRGFQGFPDKFLKWKTNQETTLIDEKNFDEEMNYA